MGKDLIEEFAVARPELKFKLGFHAVPRFRRFCL